MSVKFQEETVRAVANAGGKPEDLAHRVGERLTGGKTQTGYLAVCIIILFDELIKLELDLRYRDLSPRPR